MLPKLDALYRSRFSSIYYLMPFYRGNRADVIPVYGGSHCFHGFFAQALERFRDQRHTHYVFAADDLLLNPELNEASILAALGVGAGHSFIPGMFELHKTRYWTHTIEAVKMFQNADGVEYSKLLPPREQAEQLFLRHGLAMQPIQSKAVYGPIRWYGFDAKRLYTFLQIVIKRLYYWNKTLELPYPTVGAYSDFLVVDAGTIGEFCHLCGVLSAMNLFAEVAIPLALVLSAGCIRTEENPVIDITELDSPASSRTAIADGNASRKLHGRAIWTDAEVMALHAKYEGKLETLMKNFPPEHIYLHPIKLSKWSL
jgi:hypothetical protein